MHSDNNFISLSCNDNQNVVGGETEGLGAIQVSDWVPDSDG